MRAGAGICCLVVALMALSGCTDDGTSGDGPDADPTGSPAASEAPPASADCVATGRAVLEALDEVVQTHAGESLPGFLAALGEAPTLSSELDLSPDDIDCDQGTAFALAFERAQEIRHGTPSALLAKALLIGEFGQRLTFGSDWGPGTPVEAPVAVGDPVTTSEAEQALDGAATCRELGAALATSFQAALDLTAQLSLPQFFGVESGGEDVNEFVVASVRSALQGSKDLGCPSREFWKETLTAMTELQIQGFAPHVALGAFVQLEIYPRVYAALGS